MRNRKRLMLLIIIICVGFVESVFAQSRDGYGKPFFVYKAPEGFTITSYSKNWDTASKLSNIRKELLSNFYSNEIAYLRNIYIYPDSPDGVLAYTHYDIGRDKVGNYIYKPNTYIEIFDADDYKDISEMAWVLSHEYGHHFTTYYLIKKENKFFDGWRDTGYAKVRGIVNHPHIRYDNNSTPSQRMWDIEEIAADDYVQLFGSDNAKKSIIYKDMQQRIHQGINKHFNYAISFNMRPQENLDIPLAADINGLEQYWLNLVGVSIPYIELPPIKPQIRLVSKKEISPGSYQYRLEWDKIPGGIKYEYTLVMHPDERHSFPMAVKTVEQDKETFAIVGSALRIDTKTGKEQLVIDEYKGNYIFRLFIKSPNKKIYSSIPLKVNFNYPIITPNGIYKDVIPTDWSYNAIKRLYDLKIMVGSPDNYFYPLHNVSYAEVMTIINRYINMNTKLNGNTFESLIINTGKINQKELDYLKSKKHMTREDIALLAYHYMMLTNLTYQENGGRTPFQDDSQILRKTEINYLYEQGIMRGANGYFLPQKNISRQELASVLVGLFK